MSIEIKLSYVYALHAEVLAVSGGSAGIRDHGALESAIAQPEMSFGGQDLYPTVIEKAAALAYSVAKNHPFIDGNKRVAHGLMTFYLRSSGMRIVADFGEQERVFLSLAAGEIEREELVEWIRQYARESPSA